MIGVSDNPLQETAPELYAELKRAGEECRRTVAMNLAVMAVEMAQVDEPAVEDALRPVKEDEVMEAREQAREEVTEAVDRLEEAYEQAQQETGGRAHRKKVNSLGEQLEASRAVLAALAPNSLEASTGAAYHAIEAVGEGMIFGAAMDALRTCQMSGTDEQRAKAYERGKRRSKQAALPHLGLVAAAVVLVWILGQWISIPVWLQVVVVGSSFLALGADVVNWIRCSFNLRGLDLPDE